MREPRSPGLFLAHENIVGLMWGSGPQITADDDAFLGKIGFTQPELAEGLVDWRALTPADS